VTTSSKGNNRLIDPEKEAFLTGLTESIVDWYFPAEAPIQPSLIAKDYGITWSIGNYEDAFDGLLEHNLGRFHIYVNKDRQQTRERQRFTFCHELGHFFIDGHRNALANGEVPYHSSFTGFSSENVVEREADFFSACLLMPRKRVLRDYRHNRRFSFHIIQQLASKYGLSLLATIHRLFHLNVHPMMIVQTKKGVIHSILSSSDFYYYPKYEKRYIPEDSMMAEYVYKGIRHETTQQLWTGDWFQCWEEEKLYEHCLYYPKYDSCYSILWKD
jgi:Zn-dependent peptidase ImmA (M78 family)